MSRPPDPAVEAAAAGRVVAKKDYRHKSRRRSRKPQQARAPPGAEVDAYSIPEFCRRHGGMSTAFFFKLVREGLGPALMKVGARTMISVEPAAAWRRAREAETQQQEANETPARLR
jgi:hypothetical protein